LTRYTSAGSSSIIDNDLVQIVKDVPVPTRPVWLLYRKDWKPTAVQRLFLQLTLEFAERVG